jgi:hypothetical protein
MRDRIHVYQQDAAVFLTNVVANLPRRSLVYLDPPYFSKGAKLYIDHYEANDHAVIAHLVAKIEPQSWIVSYDDVPAIRALYRPYRGIRYELGYSARDAGKGVELIVFLGRPSDSSSRGADHRARAGPIPKGVSSPESRALAPLVAALPIARVPDRPAHLERTVDLHRIAQSGERVGLGARTRSKGWPGSWKQIS